MSSDADAAAEIVALFDELYTAYYCFVASAVLFIYDAFLPFDREVAYFWSAERITGASLLFFANKWISMTVSIIGLVDFEAFPSDKRFVCSMFVMAGQAMAILQFVPGAALSTLRAYVLSRSKLLGLLVAVLSLAPVGANLVWYGYQISGENFPPFGCRQAVNITAALDLKSASFTLITHILVIISRVPLISADILLIYITWTTLRGSAALTDIRQSKRLTLSDVLFHGGTIYFAILFVLNTLHLVLSATAVADVATTNASLITQFTAPLTAILISRFLLELQEANQTVVKLDADNPLHSSGNAWDSTPSFISSLGGFINPALSSARPYDDEDYELEVHSTSDSF
ncbi:hypothetical protein OH76DRAFT_1483313 [Lentinus brumalis]|uniref:DUF6533 domain-containing protein n=1 Tax=Lentinus brumalis TaxID=2498619 RepID=A0A371D977_9APHY|nr:hypothetical protein OH76DRAFT_1483313 [Polyporus brumalis]